MPDKTPDLNSQLMELTGITKSTQTALKFIHEDVKETKADVKKITETVTAVSTKVEVLETEVGNLKSKNGTSKWVQRIKNNYLYALMLSIGAAVVKLFTIFVGGE